MMSKHLFLLFLSINSISIIFGFKTIPSSSRKKDLARTSTTTRLLLAIKAAPPNNNNNNNNNNQAALTNDDDVDDRRSALQSCETFQTLDEKGIEKFAQSNSMETVRFDLGELVAVDRGYMYLVAPGSAFDVLDKFTQERQHALKSNMLFGILDDDDNDDDDDDMKVHLVKATSPIAKIWRFPMKDFIKIIPEDIKDDMADVMKKHAGGFMIVSK
mmetsp:Transcript_10319/g.15849  ORF Transcript_10319/g.15849 Transcript_10319/m.15849 type:complete len:215 (+) Transcript_10319:55-699(+)